MSLETKAPAKAEHSGPLARAAAWVDAWRPGIRVGEVGRVVSIGDGIAWVAGLPSAAIEDLLLLEEGSRGFVFDLAPDLVGVVLLDAGPQLTAGAHARLAGRRLSIPAGDSMLGRIVDPLGRPLDGQPVPESDARMALFRHSPPLTSRDFVSKPLYTGIRVIDTLIPIGKGQRQLIIGDEGLGRSSMAIDAVVNQRGQEVICVYVLIGQKRSAVVNTIETLKRLKALSYTTLVVAEASMLPGLKHLAPFAGCALAEHWMAEGRHTLVVYDDLSTHAQNYRELSLLLRRPPGREAYPGDIFSVHAGLLERSTCLSTAEGGGSMTALPIVETRLGEIAAYIPTNLISITDGQIYLEQDLFAGGFRPAVDVARSVSRIGGAAQHPRIKAEAGRMKLDYLRFLELEVFTRFGARLEASMEAAIRRGRVLRTILKQERLTPTTPEDNLAWLVAFNEGVFDDAALDDIPALRVRISNACGSANLTVDSPREAWVRAAVINRPEARHEASG